MVVRNNDPRSRRGRRLTIESAAQTASVSPSTMSRGVHREVVPAYKVGRRWWVWEEDLAGVLGGIPTSEDVE